MKRFHLTFGFLAGLLILLIQGTPALAVSDQPDVVIILCDDLNPFYTGYAGDPDALTPNLDALAKESAVFNRCYTASTVCMPARTSLITSLYPHNTGCWGNAERLFVAPGLCSMFSDFKAAGYATSMIGKMHWYEGDGFKSQFPSQKAYLEGIGIDHFREVATTFSSRNGSGVYQNFLRGIGKFDAQSKDLTERLANDQYVARTSLLEAEETCDWMMSDFALDYLGKAPKSQPFVMMIGFSNPHSPFDPTAKYAAMYDPTTISLRDNVIPFKKYGTDYTLDEIRKARAAYLGKISFIDDQLGRIVAALKQRGSWGNTILVFTADHGIAVGEHGNISKGSFWEEVARVPLVMRIPGLTDSGMRTEALSQLVDLYPTLIDIVGGELAPHVLGRSLLPELREPGTMIRDAVFTEIHHDNSLDYMVRDERYKWFVEGGVEQLYDLEADPMELTDLGTSATHQAVRDSLKEKLRIFLMENQINYSAGYRSVVERVKNTIEE